MPKSKISVGKKTCKIEAKIKIHSAEKSPAPHELKRFLVRGFDGWITCSLFYFEEWNWSVSKKRIGWLERHGRPYQPSISFSELINRVSTYGEISDNTSNCNCLQKREQTKQVEIDLKDKIVRIILLATLFFGCPWWQVYRFGPWW